MFSFLIQIGTNEFAIVFKTCYIFYLDSTPPPKKKIKKDKNQNNTQDIYSCVCKQTTPSILDYQYMYLISKIVRIVDLKYSNRKYL